MPYRKKYRKRKRRYRKRRRRRLVNKTSMVSRQLICPDNFYTKLKFAQRVTLTPGTAADASPMPVFTEWSGNSVFDPDPLGSISGSCAGLIEIAQFYDRYMVNAASIKLRLTNHVNDAIVCTLFPQLVSDPDILHTEIQGNAYRRVCILNQPNGGGATKHLRMSFKTKKIRGTTGPLDESYSALVTQNPTKQWIYKLVMEPVETAPNISGKVTCLVEITYYVRFWKKKQIEQL